MSRPKLFLIHTSATLVEPFKKLCDELIPHVDVQNIADDSLIRDVIAEGTVTDSVSQRLQQHLQSAASSGADMIMVTCSSIGGAAESSQSCVSVPVVRVDQAMADQAVATGARVGVIATLPTTLAPTADLIKRRAQVAGKSVEVIAKLCDGAFGELMRGNAPEHDHMVREALEELMQDVDVIVLAQASMARVVAQLPDDATRKPILSSPRLAIEALSKRFS